MWLTQEPRVTGFLPDLTKSVSRRPEVAGFIEEPITLAQITGKYEVARRLHR